MSPGPAGCEGPLRYMMISPNEATVTISNDSSFITRYLSNGTSCDMDEERTDLITSSLLNCQIINNTAATDNRSSFQERLSECAFAQHAFQTLPLVCLQLSALVPSGAKPVSPHIRA